MLYQHFFGYAMSICLRYASTREEATEVMNDGFLKIFTKLNLYDQNRSLHGWIRRIMINTAIDHLRHFQHHQHKLDRDLENAMKVSAPENILSNLACEDIIAEIQQLSPAYRTVFNMYVMDGFTHEEIAGQLGISIGTSKSNLSKARGILQQRIVKLYSHERTPYGG